MRGQGGTSQFDLVAIVQHAVDGMRLAAGRDLLQCRDVLLHRHHAGAGHFLDHRIGLHVVAVRVAAEDDLDVGEFESELLDARADHRHGLLEVGIDQDVAFRGGDQVTPEVDRADEIDVADHLMGGKGLTPFGTGVGLRRQLSGGNEHRNATDATAPRDGRSFIALQHIARTLCDNGVGDLSRRRRCGYFLLFNLRLITAFLRESKELRVLLPLDAPWKSALSS